MAKRPNKKRWSSKTVSKQEKGNRPSIVLNHVINQNITNHYNFAEKKKEFSLKDLIAPFGALLKFLSSFLG